MAGRCVTETYETEREAICAYFALGFSHMSIVTFLNHYHGIQMSVRSLRRRLSKWSLRRHNFINCSEEALVEAIREEVNMSGGHLGYRQMWCLLRAGRHIRVSRGKVEKILRQLDPVGCQRRRLRRFTRRSFHSPGPNHSWHADGYDKLKPFGFGIHGAIDAFSRRILWLKVGHSNNDPDVIGNYYLQCVRSLGVSPRFLRTDCGTENGSMATVQNMLSRSANSHLYGTSILNQRIEALWSKLRRGQINFLIHLFKDLVDNGHLDLHNQLQIGCCRFAFMHYVQNVLDRAVAYWNTHYIRRSRHGEAIPGIPDELYFLSHRFHAINYGTPVSMGDIVQCETFLPVSTIQSVTGSQIMDDYLTFVMDLKGLRKSVRWEDCISLYFILKDIATNGG